ncbi:Conserved hypothetical protein [Leptospira biflexa serovar Patoc strain 'Patoc 1 (Paris)']|uniref:Uncharacterized protein n=2 Tax=Leptospira biflexa TaxID=172 RepID=B0SU53_LEPBP|nr:Conserved hypothetical protein [Leptospira biflexa serovar Patoc strain 'Patoc 1 (Paris)']
MPLGFEEKFMWLKLGESEVINLDYVASIKKNPNQPSIEIIYQDLNNVKSLPFPGKDERDRAFKAILENLSRMKLYFE